MTVVHRQATGATALFKLLASYLVAVLLLQGLAAAFALGAGPLHQHQGATTGTSASFFAHSTHRADPHAEHHHDSNERHHHATGDNTVVLDAAAHAAAQAATQAAADSAALALTAALSLLAIQTPRAQASSGSHVLHAAPTWFWHTVLTLPLARPPSRG